MRRRIRTSVTFMLVLQTTRVHVPRREDARAQKTRAVAVEATGPRRTSRRAASSVDSAFTHTTTDSRGRPPRGRLRRGAPHGALIAAARGSTPRDTLA